MTILDTGSRLLATSFKPKTKRKLSALLISSVLPVATASAQQSNFDALLDMPINALLAMDVTTVSRQEENLFSAPAAIFVVTDEDIRRRGITELANAFRLVPGIFVANIDGNKWVVASRGFSNRFTNTLLVQIDGRTVYNPSYSGVYWDMQDVMLEDIDRIEVVRGPGASLWGANAVNGIINIITKSSKETQGTLANVEVGNQIDHIASLRYGGTTESGLSYRLYGKSRDYDNNQATDFIPGPRPPANDTWKTKQFGFRLDKDYASGFKWTLQGDRFSADENQTVALLWQPAPVFLLSNVQDNYEADSWNLLARLQQKSASGFGYELQLYRDHYERQEIYLDQEVDTYDIDFQSNFNWQQNHAVTWGAGYRHIEATYNGSFAVNINDKELDLFSAFIQDKISLIDNVWSLTLGTKLEHNDFTGFEVQPTIRTSWVPKTGHNLWFAISRAVRTPSNLEDGSNIVINNMPFLPIQSFTGSSNLDVEKLLAFEAGYRFYGSDYYSVDVALFYNDYQDVFSFEPTLDSNFVPDNFTDVVSSGIELSASWQINPDWMLMLSYSYIDLDASLDEASLDNDTLDVIEDGTPRHIASINSSYDLSSSITFDVWGRYIDDVNDPIRGMQFPIEDYVSIGSRLAWRFHKNAELAVRAENIFEPGHLEYVDDQQSTPTEISRSVSANLRLEF